MSENVNQTGAIKVGAKVRFDWGLYRLTGTVVEDRGNIGVGGRRLWRIVAPVDPVNNITIELSEADLERVAEAKRVRAKRPLVKRKVTVRMSSAKLWAKERWDGG